MLGRRGCRCFRGAPPSPPSLPESPPDSLPLSCSSSLTSTDLLLNIPARTGFRRTTSPAAGEAPCPDLPLPTSGARAAWPAGPVLAGRVSCRTPLLLGREARLAKRTSESEVAPCKTSCSKSLLMLHFSSAIWQSHKLALLPNELDIGDSDRECATKGTGVGAPTLGGFQWRTFSWGEHVRASCALANVVSAATFRSVSFP
mmetsp:Transcript_11077/g.25610  ORF Transcript_11077/g.25610 Transcript_11077/m.25610 type:complete len:201 (-) Transcript_11077:251-853(-)